MVKNGTTTFLAVLRIRDILVRIRIRTSDYRIRIRIRIQLQLRILLFRQLPSWRQLKIILFFAWCQKSPDPELDPDPHLILTVPWGPKTYGSGSGTVSGSATLISGPEMPIDPQIRIRAVASADSSKHCLNKSQTAGTRVDTDSDYDMSGGLRSSLVVRASDCKCTSCNGPGFEPSIRRHSGIWGAADEAVLNTVWK